MENHPDHESQQDPKADQPTPQSEQELHARRLIEQGIASACWNASNLDAATARVMAASVHAGIGTHLERFASTGELNPEAALAELLERPEAIRYPLNWLVDFLKQIITPDADRVSPEHEEPDPRIFVQADDPERGLQADGAWLDPCVSAEKLEEEIGRIASQIHLPTASARVTATVGFFGVDIAPSEGPATITAYANGIAEYGESFALLSKELGRPCRDKEFRSRYEGTYASIEEVMANFTDRMLDAVRQNGGASDQGRRAAFDRFEAEIRKHYLCLEGRDGVHVFNRRKGARGGNS